MIVLFIYSRVHSTKTASANNCFKSMFLTRTFPREPLNVLPLRYALVVFLCYRYTPPDIFQPSLFDLVKESRRPPYRWFLIGPKRSGTTVHVDPLGTSVGTQFRTPVNCRPGCKLILSCLWLQAWNALLHGRKRWVIFSPSTPKSIVKGKQYVPLRRLHSHCNTGFNFRAHIFVGT